MAKAAKIAYAQSSDIKPRDFLQYRHDMKRKAIAELEFLDFLRTLFPGAAVEKHGSDSERWFLRPTEKISQAPDYKVTYQDGSSELLEFQYAEEVRTDSYDFKISKVGKKAPGAPRVPHADRRIFYVVKPAGRYALIDPAWIMQGRVAETVKAWRSEGYRVPADVFNEKLEAGGAEMEAAISATNDKNVILEHQRRFLEGQRSLLSHDLQSVVDVESSLEITSHTLWGTFQVCLILSEIGEVPQRPASWLRHLCHFLDDDSLDAEEVAQWMFAFDFLYFLCEDLQGDEVQIVRKCLERLRGILQSWRYQDGRFCEDGQMHPREQTINILHTWNLFEDVWQDFAVRHGHGEKVKKLFELLPDAHEVAEAIRQDTAAEEGASG